MPFISLLRFMCVQIYISPHGSQHTKPVPPDSHNTAIGLSCGRVIGSAVVVSLTQL